MIPSWDILKRRSQIIQTLRGGFEARGYTEVQTPVLGRHGAFDPHLHSIEVSIAGQPRYLQTSPEYALKQVLAAHGQRIFQIGPVFRGGDIGPKHQPEFTMAEWYAPGLELPLLMEEMVNLIREFPFVPKAFSDPLRHFQYRDLMIEHVGVDPECVDDAALRQRLDQYPIEANHLGDLVDSQWRSDALDFLFSSEVQPQLTGLCTVTGFPRSQAALAEIDDASGLSLRMELFFSGLELINAYQELRDTDELERRWAEANAARAARGLPQLALDEGLKAAMADMPPSAGAAMGVDRLVLCLLDLERLDQAMVLPWV